ncbi:3-oxoacyl-[acyl-carrier-protein] synthase, KASIII [hydrothermal vent metagenome]|uniref:beta-ketoacyl-[acyl-carrier-protein] synthase III n=1 Tax=hydrothermal vent metagenome TaxID=652676 RepID=A0A3B0SFP4_9ZZZZ
MNATIIGWGNCVPQSVLSNDDLSSVIDTSDEWITSRSGIKERRVSHVNNSDMAALAGKRALGAAGLDASDLDYIIVATCTADRQIPSTACYVQAKIGALNAAATDLNAGCTGFLYGLSMGHGLLATGQARRVLVIGSERISSFLNLEERSTAVLFGDGAGAVILEGTESSDGMAATLLGSDGNGAEALTAHGVGTEFIGSGVDTAIVMDGAEIFRNAVVRMEESVVRVAELAGWNLDEIDLIIPHQANIRIIDAVRRRVGVSEDKVFVNIHRYGNTSAATIPIALAEAVDEGRIQPGHKMVFVAFGAGMTWGAVALKWGERVDPIETIDEELPVPKMTALEMVVSNQKALHA